MLSWTCVLCLGLAAALSAPALAYSMPEHPPVASAADEELPSAPEPQPDVVNPAQNSAMPIRDRDLQLWKVLGFSANPRVVAPGATPAPYDARRALLTATQNSFSATSFLLLGATTMMAEGIGTHEDLGKGVPGFGRYAWRGLLDKADGNYWTLFLLPTLLREDNRYYIQGSGGVKRRAAYAVSRVFVSRTQSGLPTINGAQLLGRGAAQAISTTYYPDADRTASEVASKLGFALLRDAASNTFREFWPEGRRLLRRLGR